MRYGPFSIIKEKSNWSNNCLYILLVREYAICLQTAVARFDWSSCEYLYLNYDTIYLIIHCCCLCTYVSRMRFRSSPVRLTRRDNPSGTKPVRLLSTLTSAVTECNYICVFRWECILRVSTGNNLKNEYLIIILLSTFVYGHTIRVWTV